MRARALLGALALWALSCVEEPDAVPADAALGPAPCAAELAWFRDRVWTPIVSPRCLGCHSPQGPARASAMVLRDDGSEAAVVDGFQRMRVQALRRLGDDPVLLLRPSGRHPQGHTGGRLVAADSPEYAELQRFVRLAETEACDPPGGTAPDPTAAPMRCPTPTPGLPTVRRLSRTEYDQTVSDLLGVRSTYASRMVPDTVVDGFDNNASALVVSGVLADQLQTAAEALAHEAAEDLPRLAGCALTAGAEETCASAFFARFGPRAFRRPLREGEAGRYLALFREVLPREGARAALEAMVAAALQSPHFLYRTELGAPSPEGLRLTPYEVASELSYLLWGSMPDDALFAAARDGNLATEAQIEAQARRMLDDPRARGVVRRFMSQWLGVENLATVPRDATRYVAFTPEVRASMRGEFDRFVEAVVFGPPGGGLAELLTGRPRAIDPALARFYGVTAPRADGFGEAAALDEDRVGVLTLGAVLAVHARPTTSSPIHRGRLVRERLLCQPLPPPPPGLNAQLADVTGARTTRERFAIHGAVAPCVNCHRLMDPIGFAFERYDGVGRFRADEGGAAIDTSGEVYGAPRTPLRFTSARELFAGLAASDEVRECFASQWTRFAFGSESTEALRCTAAELQARAREGASVRDLLVALTQTRHFRFRQGPATTGDAGTGDAAVDAAADAPGADVTDVPRVVADAGTTSSEGLTVTPLRDSTWETGYCERVQLTNRTGAPIVWRFVRSIEGRLQSHWNAEVSGDTGPVTFTGVAWNRSLAPGAMDTSVGYCVQR